MPAILVVDDEKIIRDGCIKILSKEGWAVQTASSGAEGLQRIGEQSFDLLLLDLKMPGLSGMEVLQRLRASHPDLLIVVITGYATVESAVEAMKAGAYDFIPKPFTPDQLRIVVHRALEKKTLEQEAKLWRLEREKGLREIAGEKSRTKTIIHSMADGVLVTDHEGQVVLYNPPAIHLLKMDRAPQMGQPLQECLSHDSLAELVKKIRQVSAEKDAAISLEVQLEERTLLAHIAPVRSEEEEILGTVTLLRDISMLKAMDRAKSEFVAMVSHELRSPLTSVEQQLSVIGGGILGDLNERQKEMLGRAKERTHALLDLINDLLDLSKIEAGFAIQHKEPIAIHDLLEKVAGLMNIQAEAKKITLTLSIPEPLPLVMADRKNMEEVFINLLSNALKYTGEGGRVKIEASTKGGFLLVQVSDSGIGISSKDLPHIFDKFYRVKNPQTRKITGTGLGLHITKKIVEAHLGMVEVESELGVGSTFRVYLPLEPTFERKI